MSNSSHQKANIFISYRRADTAGHTGRLYDRLISHFGGQTQIFMDLDSIAPGADFIATIEKAVGSCDVVIAMIGDQWLAMKDADGKPRIHNPEDFVRAEIATALKRNILMIPVLVEGAPMPRAEDLPPELAKLVRLNALEISDSRWEHDTRRLVECLEQELGTAPSAAASPSGAPRPLWKKPLAIGAVIVALLCLALLWRGLSQPGSPPQPSPVAESEKATLPGASSEERANAIPSQPAASGTASAAAINSSGSRSGLPSSAGTINLLAADNGGKLLIASTERWKATIDGNESTYGYFYKKDFAVLAFRDERPATLESLAVFVPSTSVYNLKDFELFVSNESPEGKFESLGKFQLKNYRLVEDPFQKIDLPKVKARYVKMAILSNQEDSGAPPYLYELRLMGRLD